MKFVEKDSIFLFRSSEKIRRVLKDQTEEWRGILSRRHFRGEKSSSYNDRKTSGVYPERYMSIILRIPQTTLACPFSVI